MSTEITKPTASIEVEETRPEVLTKMKSWATLGAVIHDANLQFQVKAQASVKKLIRKPGKLLVLDAENALKEVKKELADHTPERIKITSKFDAVRTALSAPEVLWQETINAAASELLAVKQEIAADAQAEKNKTDELARIRLAIANKISKVDANYKTMIALRITDSYERALNGECPTEDTRAFIAKELEWATEEIFIWKRPNINPTYCTAEQVTALWDELALNQNPPSFYTAKFKNDLEEKFEFYSINLKQKDSSIARAKEEQATKISEIAKDKDMAAAGARLETIATTYTTAPEKTAKGLKQEWKVQMEDSEASMLAIISAFVGNYATCKGGMRVKSPMKLSVEQMSTCLSWAKNRDENFKVSNINFVLVDKL